MNQLVPTPPLETEGEKGTRVRKKRGLDNRGSLHIERRPLWWHFKDWRTGGNSLRWHLTTLWAPVVLRSSDYDRIYRFLKKADEKKCGSGILGSDLARCLARNYRERRAQFGEGVVHLMSKFFVEWIFTHTMFRTRRLLIAHLMSMPPLSFPLDLIKDLENAGFQFQAADRKNILIHITAWEQLDASEAGHGLDRRKYHFRVPKWIRTWHRSFAKN